MDVGGVVSPYPPIEVTIDPESTPIWPTKPLPSSGLKSLKLSIKEEKSNKSIKCSISSRDLLDLSVVSNGFKVFKVSCPRLEKLFIQQNAFFQYARATDYQVFAPKLTWLQFTNEYIVGSEVHLIRQCEEHSQDVRIIFNNCFLPMAHDEWKSISILPNGSSGRSMRQTKSATTREHF